MSEVTPGDRDALRRIMDERAVADVDLPPLDRDAALVDAILAAGFRRVSPVTREGVQELIAETREAANGQEWVNHSDTLLSRLADALESLSASPPAEVPTLNPSVVLAALDQMLEPWTLHRDAQLSALRIQIRRLRARVYEWVPVSPVRGE